MVDLTRSAATLKWVAALVTALAAVLMNGCSNSSDEASLDVQETYLNSLRGANSLAHGTAEQPPRAALAPSAHAVALLKSRGVEVNLDPQLWNRMIESSGENSTWVAYYLCMAGSNLEQIEQFTGRSASDIITETAGKKKVDDSREITANTALEELVERKVLACLGEQPDTGVVETQEPNSLIVRARLKRMGYGGGPAASEAEIAHVESLVLEQGCTDWNQASAWAVLALNPEAQNQVLENCRMSVENELNDPVALYTSTELGMPNELVEKFASTEELETWLSEEWAIRDQDSESRGNGTLENTVALVELTRIKGWKIPDWVAVGVKDASSSGTKDVAAMLYLCQTTNASCDSRVGTRKISQLEVAGKVLDESVTDTEGRLLAMASLENVDVQ